MSSIDSQHELLLRYLDGHVKPEERVRVADGGARAFLREVAEQSVMIADLQRTAAGRQARLGRSSYPSRISGRCNRSSPHRRMARN